MFLCWQRCVEDEGFVIVDTLNEEKAKESAAKIFDCNSEDIRPQRADYLDSYKTTKIPAALVKAERDQIWSDALYELREIVIHRTALETELKNLKNFLTTAKTADIERYRMCTTSGYACFCGFHK